MFSDEEIKQFIQRHEAKGNTLYGLYASSYSTIMFTDSLLIGTFGLTFTNPMGIAIVSIALVNIVLDKYLFDLLEKLLLIKINAEKREMAKFLLLLLASIVCLSLGHYIIPLVLLAFMSGYFINYMLQQGQLSDTVIKIFLTRDENGHLRLFQGFMQDHVSRNTLWLGALLSIVFAAAMAALAAKWLLPFIGGAALLGSLLSPLGIIVCAALAVYGTIWFFLVMRGWADLIQLDAQLKTQYDCGIFSWFAVLMFVDKFIEGMKEYYYRPWKIIYLLFSIFSMYGMVYTINVGCATIGDYINSAETGMALTVLNSAAQTPFMLKNAAIAALPEEEVDIKSLGLFARCQIECYRLINAIRQAFVPNGGEVPHNTQESLLIFSTAAASATAAAKVKVHFSKIEANLTSPLGPLQNR
jgi:hypothetical protein